jgi:NAD(P)-dependent dehydrogenase (short-subunit alcohol dehydrogenase family)
MGERRRRRVALRIAAGAVGLAVARWVVAERRAMELTGRVVFVTGGSRGLGFAVVREFASRGCRLALCARDADELNRAAADLRAMGADVLPIPCDVSVRSEIEAAIQTATELFGQIDILVNNAGIIQVGPVETMTVADFERAMATMFWGTLYATLAVLPQMRARREGRIVNITSVGGKIAMPHLLPYDAAKFAATGFSEGLRAELAKDSIRVTTIAPGLLRTGGHLNAEVKGEREAEFAWFSVGDTLPFAALDAEQAAREIVRAARRGDAERILSLPASIAARLYSAFPAASADFLGLVNRALPPAKNGATQAQPGGAIKREMPTPFRRALDTMGGPAARDLNQPRAPEKGMTDADHHPS